MEMRYCFLFIASDQRFSNISLLLIFLRFLCLSCTYRFFFLQTRSECWFLKLVSIPSLGGESSVEFEFHFFFSCFTRHSSSSRALYIENGASFAVFSSSFLSFGSENSLLCMKIPFPSPFVLITGAESGSRLEFEF